MEKATKIANLKLIAYQTIKNEWGRGRMRHKEAMNERTNERTVSSAIKDLWKVLLRISTE